MSLAELETIFFLEHGEDESLLAALDLTCDRLETEGLLVRSQRDGWTWYSIRFYLDPAIDPADVKRSRYYEYEKIQAARLEGAGSGVPNEYESPLIPFLPEFNQAGVPSCVGHAGAFAAQANYLAVTGDRPETTKIVRDQVDPATGMIFDQFFRTVFSPWWIYCLTRKRGHITAPGSRTELVPEILKEIGGVTWDKVLTPKTTDRAPELSDKTIEELRTTAAGHRIRSYAKITTWEGLLEAIATNGGRGIIMPINLWEDYTNPLPDGTLRCSPGKAIAGSHSLFWPSYKDGKLIALNSWGSFLRNLKISREYWETMAGPAFVFLDNEETRIAQAIYVLTTISAVMKKKDGTEVPLTCSWIMVDQDKYTNVSEVKAMLEGGREYKIRAQATITARVTARVIEETIRVPEGVDASFNKIIFEEGGNSINDFLKKLRAFFK